MLGGRIIDLGSQPCSLKDLDCTVMEKSSGRTVESCARMDPHATVASSIVCDRTMRSKKRACLKVYQSEDVEEPVKAEGIAEPFSLLIDLLFFF